jgi:hypothetical protein
MFTRLHKLLSKFNKSIKIINNIDILIETKLATRDLLTGALNSDESITQPSRKHEKELIVNLTTYNKRINDVHLVIESIARQTEKPDRIILWLDESEFTLNSLPHVLHKQINRGLEVKFCPNYLSYKKLIPAIQSFPDADLITIDDDILYPYDMIELLVKEHHQYPDLVIGHRAHKMKSDLNNKLLPYAEWDNETSCDVAGHDIFITTGGGTFFPSSCMNNEVTNSKTFLSICPFADDIWVKAMLLLSGTQCKKVSDTREFGRTFIMIVHSQDIALSGSDTINERNDSQLSDVFTRYNLDY